MLNRLLGVPLARVKDVILDDGWKLKPVSALLLLLSAATIGVALTAGTPPRPDKEAFGVSQAFVQPVHTATPRRLSARSTLCVTANHNAIAFTFRTPRTSKRINPRLRACALTHSAVEARSL